MDLAAMHLATRPALIQEIVLMKRALYKTSKWRKVKRYRLFEKIDKAEEILGLLDHVLLFDDVSF